MLPGREADGERAFGKTPRMIDVFERAIGVPYPYARYSQIAVADFIFGGMENTSATTQTDRMLHDERAHLDYSADYLVSHELAHQWFGDLVTCRDWAHAWLNEGFATYFETVWLEADEGWDEYLYDVYGIVQRYLEEDAERYRRPIVCNLFRDPIELFDRHLYEKGARGAAHAARRARLGAHAALARSATCATTRSATSRRSTWSARSRPRPAATRAASSLSGSSAAATPSSTWRTAGTASARPRCSRSRRSRPSTTSTRPTSSTSRSASSPDAPPSVATNAGHGPAARRDPRAAARSSARRRRSRSPLEREPGLVRVDPAAWILCAWTSSLGTDAHAAILRGDPSPSARIRAAKALAKDGSRVAREALAARARPRPVLGRRRSRSPRRWAARARPRRARRCSPTSAHPHPKVRRAVAEALGDWRDAEVASALLGLRDGRVVLRRRARRCTRWARRATRARSTRSSRRRDAVVERDDRRRRACAGWASWPTRAACRCCSPRSSRSGPSRCAGPRSRAVALLGTLVDAVAHRGGRRDRAARCATPPTWCG